ncbi:TadE family type IV pilus minor pilin [Nocardia sp. NPDC051570]|uniref:TadE family type IV pilus minor pilin n=1 Tax=Nocardia sp. NPDC051570 TaxID=3364324 RepID=UPI003789F68E
MSRPDGERGAVTVEAAIALAALIAVVVLCLAALLAASAQVRCVDAAREAARSSARGADAGALAAARRVAPSGATVSVHDDGDLVVATADVRVPLFPLLVLRAEAVAFREPGVRE